MASRGLKLGLVAGRGRRVLPVMGRGQASGRRAVRWVALEPALVPAAVSQLEFRGRPFLGREPLQVLHRIGGPAGR